MELILERAGPRSQQASTWRELQASESSDVPLFHVRRGLDRRGSGMLDLGGRLGLIHRTAMHEGHRNNRQEPDDKSLATIDRLNAGAHSRVSNNSASNRVLPK